eukprot:241659_1
MSRGKGEAPTATIMGQTEGHIVRGGKVSKYLCKQWEAEFNANKFNPKPNYKPFGALYEAAFEQVMNETPQQLTAAEYDIRINKVVFVPNEILRGRGTKESGQADGTVPVIDDDLRNILGPQPDSKLNLMQYFFVLFNANYKDRKSLCGLSNIALGELGIGKAFHQKELLRRVSKLTMQ